MFTEPELIQSQRELLRQVRAANRMRTDVEQAATAKQKAAQQQAEAALTAATNQADSALAQALTQADVALHKTKSDAQATAEHLQEQSGKLCTTVLVATSESQQFLRKANLSHLFTAATVTPPKAERKALLALEQAAAQAAPALRDIQEAIEELLEQRAAEARRRKWIQILRIIGPVLLLVVGWSQYTHWQREQERQAALANLEAATLHTWQNPADNTFYVQVPAGSFQMGSDNREADERPVHTVTLDEYWIMQTEVTNAHYTLCVNTGACTPANNAYWRDGTWSENPVTHVDWFQATDYCAWAGARLPTEAEWEKAARGTDGRTYPWGNSGPDTTRLNHNGTVRGTTPIGSYPVGASPYGVLDMAGNVWEWVNDWYQFDYYSVSPGSNPQGPATGIRRVLRGGSWLNDVNGVRSAVRFGSQPDLWNNYVGFRCVRSP